MFGFVFVLVVLERWIAWIYIARGEVSRVATSDCFFCQSKDEEEAVETGLEDGLHWQYHHTFCSGFRFSPEAKPKEQSGPKDEDEEAFSFGIQT